jgi:hypothetical protein
MRRLDWAWHIWRGLLMRATNSKPTSKELARSKVICMARYNDELVAKAKCFWKVAVAYAELVAI